MKNIVSTEVKPASVTFTVERSIDAIRGDFTVNGTEVLFKAGAKVNGEELAYLLSEDMKESDAKTVRMANMMRLARKLPAVKEGDKEIPAFDYVKDRLRLASNSSGAFYTMFQLVESLDVIELNPVLKASSVFSIKNAISAFRQSGALPKAGSNEPLKLKAGKAKPLVKALAEGATQAKVAEIVSKMGVTKSRKKAATPPANPEPEKVKQTVEGIKASIVSARGQWELGVQEGLKVEEIRQACFEEVQILARLAGYEMVRLDGGKNSPPKSTPPPANPKK